MFWNQRRALIAYTGSSDDPGYVHLRVLHDHYDFASARLVTAQHKGNVLAAVGFVTDGGDAHPGLDPVREETIDVCDLRLRFEFGGSAANVALPSPESPQRPLVIDFGTVALHLQWTLPPGVPPLGIAVGRDHAHAWVDLIWLAERRKKLLLRDLSNPVIGITLIFGDSPTAPPPAWHGGETIGELIWDVDGRQLAVRIPLHPQSGKEWATCLTRG